MLRPAMTLIAAAALAPALTACVITVDDSPGTTPPGVNTAPYVTWANAECKWSEWQGDYVWAFEAEVWDDQGLGDVRAVYADIYDARGSWVDTFELYQENYPEFWFSDWLQYYSYLDCSYGGYTIDFVAYDTVDNYDIYTVTRY